ncbi:sugar ABC transporter substrate-binding protein [uncultured Alsobacter sp.]|uniref:sugar ABC transporter substrate-binding protein n=1 Tax=uncultured Alsobacter sp. TaxID=1748258 RepID=UPI0025CE27CA|nr:sugar ABC transporter substrate-binding protein [uncultured Alsobacter sp.]
MTGLSRRALLASGCLLVNGAGFAQDRPTGITRPQAFPAFDENAAPCAPPPGRERSLVFAQDNDRQFMQGVAAGLSAAARDRGLAFRVATAANDPNQMIRHVREAKEQKAGAVVAAPINASTLAPALMEMIWDGGYVGTIVPPPAVSLLNAPQFLTGRALGDAAVSYIRSRLNGKARVVLLTHDTNQYLAQRFVAIRQALKELPDVSIVADISPQTVNKEGGYATMQMVLLAHANIDVVLGADTVVLGALAALRAAGKARPDQFLGGIDGEPEAVAELKAGTVYKASISLASPVFGYAMGQHAADWLDGRSIPQAMDILPTTLSASNITQYEADLADPGAVYRDRTRRDRYLKMYGNICYETRDRFVNFAWSSERRP